MGDLVSSYGFPYWLRVLMILVGFWDSLYLRFGFMVGGIVVNFIL